MSSRVIQTEEIQSSTGQIKAVEGSRYAIDDDITYEDLQGNETITKDMADERFGQSVTPFIRELKPNQAVPVAVPLPNNFEGKCIVTAKIERSSGIWEIFPSAMVQELLDITYNGGAISDYFVNRVDLYGTGSPESPTNLDHLIFTFSKA